MRCCFVAVIVVVVVAAALPCCGLQCPCKTQTSGGGGWLLPGIAQAQAVAPRRSSSALRGERETSPTSHHK